MTHTNQDIQREQARAALVPCSRKTREASIALLDRSGLHTDEELFEGVRYIFREGIWVFLALRGQIPNANDYLTVQVGRQPVVITRDRAGQLHGLITCHRGAILARHKKEQPRPSRLPFHGWTFSSAGKLLRVEGQNPMQLPRELQLQGQP